MKKSLIIAVLALAMVFAFAGAAMADHSPQFYFNWQAGSGVTASPTFQAVFEHEPLIYTIDNGSYALGTASPHKLYSQNSAKCSVCHSVHRAPTLGTQSLQTTGAITTSSRYSVSQYTAANVDTQLLLKSTANGACSYCHIESGYHLMYGGDATMAWTTGPASTSWNEFYGHTNSCTQCHAVHGAYTLPDSKILKYEGVKASSTFELQVQPEVYSTSPLWTTKQNMIDGVLTAGAIADGVTLEDAAVTAHCSICHANYSPDNNTLINADLKNVQLFQSGAWGRANTYTDGWIYGVQGGTWSNTFSMKYKNHPMKNADALFSSSGATLNATDGPVSVSDSYTCQTCHNSPDVVLDGMYIIQSWPHYTPGYYKFMAAQNQSAFATPKSLGDVNLGRMPFFEKASAAVYDGQITATEWGKGPAIMNDGYCLKCHTKVGTSPADGSGF